MLLINLNYSNDLPLSSEFIAIFRSGVMSDGKYITYPYILYLLLYLIKHYRCKLKY